MLWAEPGGSRRVKGCHKSGSCVVAEWLCNAAGIRDRLQRATCNVQRTAYPTSTPPVMML
jgi:hypothetical protein